MWIPLNGVAPQLLVLLEVLALPPSTPAQAGSRGFAGNRALRSGGPRLPGSIENGFANPLVSHWTTQARSSAQRRVVRSFLKDLTGMAPSRRPSRPSRRVSGRTRCCPGDPSRGLRGAGRRCSEVGNVRQTGEGARVDGGRTRPNSRGSCFVATRCILGLFPLSAMPSSGVQEHFENLRAGSEGHRPVVASG